MRMLVKYREEFINMDIMNKLDETIDRKISDMMTRMEREFGISMIPTLNGHVDPEVMEFYRMLSNIRS